MTSQYKVYYDMYICSISEANNLLFIETSALSGSNIEAAYLNILNGMHFVDNFLCKIAALPD